MNEDAQSNGDQLKAIIASLTQATGPAKPFNKANANTQDSTTSKLYEDLKKVIKNLDDTIKENVKLVRSVSDLKKAITGREKSSKPMVRELSGSGSYDKKISSSLSKMTQIDQATARVQNKFYQAGLKKGSIYTHDVHIIKELEKLNETFAQVRDCVCGDKKEKVEKKLILPESSDDKAFSSPSKAMDQPEDNAADDAARLKTRWQELFVLERYKRTMADISRAAADVQITLLGFTAFNKITEDLVKKEREFAQEVRTVAYQTMGVTKESRNLQHALTEIGTSSAITGMNRSETQKSYIDNLKKGLRDQKTALKVSKTQLHTERMIGVEAGTLSENFTNMTLQMGMSTDQIDNFSRGIKQVARDTGVTGSNLASAVKSSEPILKNLRNAARMNTDAAKNVVGLMASAEKLGVAEGLGNIAGTISKGLHGITNASKGTQTLLLRAAGSVGAVGDLYSGALLNSKQGLKSLSSGLRNFLKDFNIQSLDQIKNMTDEQKSFADMQIRTATQGEYGLGELQKMIESLDENSKSVKDKLEDIRKKRLKNLSEQEKNALLEEERGLKTSTSLDVLSKLAESAKDAKSMGDALSNFQQKLPGMSDDLNALGINSKDAKSAGKEALKAAIDGVNAGLKKAKKQELKVSTKDMEKALNDPAAFRTLTEQINEKNKELGVAQDSQTDVLKNMTDTLTQLNDTLRGRVQGFLGNLLDSTLASFIFYTSAAAGGMLDIGHKALDSYVLLRQANITREGLEKGLGSMMQHWGIDIKNVGASWGTLFGPEAMAAAASTLTTVAIAAGAIAAVAGAIYGSVSAGENAAELFGKQMEDVTMAEFYAAKGAGAITGALNFLTLGIFDSFLGSTGIVTKWLAQFNKMIPILSAVMAVLDIIAGAVWGLVLSVKDVFVGAFEMIYMILEPFGILINGIGEAIGIILSPLFGFTTGLEKSGSLFKIFADIFGVFGRVLRTVMQVIGFIIGGLLKIFVGILVPMIKAVAYFLSIFTNIIGYVFNTIAEGVMGIVQFFQGLFTLDFSKMGKGLWNVFSSMLLGIPNLLLRIIAGIPSFIIDGVKSWGMAIITGIGNGLSSLGSWIIGWFTELPSSIYSALYKAASAVGLGWLVESIGGKPKDKKSQEGFDAMKKVAEEGTKKGSLYTHDIYLERQMIALNAMLAMSDIGGSAIGSVMGSLGSLKTKSPSAKGADTGGFFSGLMEKYEGFKQKFFDNSFFQGISDRYNKLSESIFGVVEDNVSGPAKKMFSPLTKGFSKAREDGKGYFESLSRGVKGQYMSMTKGGIAKKGSFLDNTKNKILENYDWAKEGLLGSEEGEKVKKGLLQRAKDGLLGEKDGEKVKKGILQRAKDGLFGEKADFAKGITGQKGLIDIAKEKGQGLKDKVFGKKDAMTGVTSGGLLDQAKNKAKGLYESSKEKIFGKKLGENEMGPAKPGLLDQAKNKAKGLYESGKEKLGFGKKEGEGLEKVAESGNKIGAMENAKIGLKNLAEGLKALAGRDVLFGALNLIPASIGLVAMVAGSAGAYLVSKIDGEALKTGLTGLAEGLKTMANAKVLLGALTLIPAAAGFVLMLPGLAGMALLGVVGPLAQAGLSALASGLKAFGQAAMNPYFWLGLAALAAFNVALIPLAFALSLLAPLVEAFGKAIKSAFEGIATIVDSVMGGLKGFMSELTLERAGGIIAVSGALLILSGSLLAFGAAVAGGGILSFFGGNGILDKIMLLSAAGQNLMITATAMQILSESVKTFDQNLDSFLANSDKIDQFTAIASEMATISPKANVMATTAPNENMQSSVQRELISSEPSNKIESSDLGTLASEGKTQTQQLIEAVSLLQQIADSLSKDNTTGTSMQVASDTSTNKQPSKPANYYPWGTGKQSQTAQRV